MVQETPASIYDFILASNLSLLDGYFITHCLYLHTLSALAWGCPCMCCAQGRSHWVSEIPTEQLLCRGWVCAGSLQPAEPGWVKACHHPCRTALNLRRPKTSAKGASAITLAVSLHQAAWAPAAQHWSHRGRAQLSLASPEHCCQPQDTESTLSVC